MLVARHAVICVSLQQARLGPQELFPMNGHESFHCDVTQNIRPGGEALFYFLANTYPTKRIPLDASRSSSYQFATDTDDHNDVLLTSSKLPLLCLLYTSRCV